MKIPGMKTSGRKMSDIRMPGIRRIAAQEGKGIRNEIG